MGKSNAGKKTVDRNKMTTKSEQSKASGSKKQSKKQKLGDKRLAQEITTIGFRLPGFQSADQLKMKEAGIKAKLGGKAAGLAQMVKMKIPVPPALNLSTALCQNYLLRQKLPAALEPMIERGLKAMEKSLSKTFGSYENPLLLSVRSGAPVSMPGMMDTVLNLGLNTEMLEELAERTPEKARFWWDCYRRFIVMFADVVMGMERAPFEQLILQKKQEEGVDQDSALSAKALRELSYSFLRHCSDSSREFPLDPKAQLVSCVEAVFKSWNSERAKHYRELNGISGDLGTAVTIQAMVFGNFNDQSATGVVFTRNPSSGEKALYGEFLMNAQGEDVVAGIRTPKDIEEMSKSLPKAWAELKKTLDRLETKFVEVQDVEFTIEDAKLYILQTRNAKRTAVAALEHLHQFVKEKKISRKEALRRMSFPHVNQLLHPSLRPTDQPSLAKGLPASPGAVSGRIALDSETAAQMRRAEQRVILVRHETSPEDIGGIAASEGILTATGGMTSHAAVVGRGMGKSCVVGCGDLHINMEDRSVQIASTELKEGASITLNGNTGDIYEGELPTEAVSWTRSAQEFFKWADSEAKMQVLANADTPDQATTARELGAQGIGLCRTEHMFFEEERLQCFREMILAEEIEKKEERLNRLLPYQREDFRDIFFAMKSLSVCVRLLDPPLHEFVPRLEDAEEIKRIALALQMSEQQVQRRIQQLHEMNPMLGHRGCRLGLTEPKVYEMQVIALAQGLAQAFAKKADLELKIMIPLIISVRELELLLPRLRECFEQALRESEPKNWKKLLKKVKWGTMIEIPRACLVADEIADQVDFISFGTNDLTQAGCGISRDDSAKFLPFYVENGIFAEDPFQTLDQKGIGQLIEICLKRARKVNKKLEVGVCGEHGGDPESIRFFQSLKFESVSCSPFRVPVARLAAARSIIGNLNK